MLTKPKGTIEERTEVAARIAKFAGELLDMSESISDPKVTYKRWPFMDHIDLSVAELVDEFDF